MARTASSLAKQVADLRLLVDAHLARTQCKPVLYATYDKGASDAEIETQTYETTFGTQF